VTKPLCTLAALVFGACSLGGCFKAPVELQRAVVIQQQEITQVKAFYNDAIQKLFDEIEQLQLHYVDQIEVGMIDKAKFKRGENPGTISSDDTLNVVFVPIQDRIHSFANEQRAKIRENIESARKQYLSLNQPINDIDSINKDLGAYIDSLIRYRRAQDALGQALLNKVNSIAPISLPSPASIGKLLDNVQSDFTKSAEVTSPSIPEK